MGPTPSAGAQDHDLITAGEFSPPPSTDINSQLSYLKILFYFFLQKPWIFLQALSELSHLTSELQELYGVPVVVPAGSNVLLRGGR